MTVFNLGSINIDNVYRVPHLPSPGETLAATGYERGLGGKGANMSVAATRAGARTIHIGAVGADGGWACEQMRDAGVDIRHIARLTHTLTGHAIINVDRKGENAIVLVPGANREIPENALVAALAEAKPGDTLLLQNETILQTRAVEIARDHGLFTAFAAAPFEIEATNVLLPWLDFLILNEIEAHQLTRSTGKTLAELDVDHVIVTLGAKGARWFHGGQVQEFPALPVTPVDTTGAGDTFTGYVLAARDQGLPMGKAIDLAGRAAALAVTRHGAVNAIPALKEVREAQF